MSVWPPRVSAESEAQCYGVILQRGGSAIFTVLGLLREMRTPARRQPLIAASANQPSASHSFGLLAEISRSPPSLPQRQLKWGAILYTQQLSPNHVAPTCHSCFQRTSLGKARGAWEQRALVTRTDAGGPSTSDSGSRPGRIPS